jgi:hypothetical protein
LNFPAHLHRGELFAKSSVGIVPSDFDFRADHSGRSNDMMISSLWTPPKKALPRAIPSAWKPMAW